VVRSGHDDLATIQVSLKNESSLPAVILGSMVIVRGLSAGAFGDPASPQEAVRGGSRLTVQSLIVNNAVIFPGVTYAHNVVVQVPASGPEPAAVETALQDHYGRVKNNRYETFVLDPAMTAPPSRPAGS
jgi:hypothetical protein